MTIYSPKILLHYKSINAPDLNYILHASTVESFNGIKISFATININLNSGAETANENSQMLKLCRPRLYVLRNNLSGLFFL